MEVLARLARDRVPRPPHTDAPLSRATERAGPDAKCGSPITRIFGAAAAEYFRKCWSGVEYLATFPAPLDLHIWCGGVTEAFPGHEANGAYSLLHRNPQPHRLLDYDP